MLGARTARCALPVASIGKEVDPQAFMKRGRPRAKGQWEKSVTVQRPGGGASMPIGAWLARQAATGQVRPCPAHAAAPAMRRSA